MSRKGRDWRAQIELFEIRLVGVEDGDGAMEAIREGTSPLLGDGFIRVGHFWCNESMAPPMVCL